MSSPFFPDPVPDPRSPLSPLPVVFDRVTIDYLMLGNARIMWEINPHFREPGPWAFQLQAAESDVLPVDNSNWQDVGGELINTFMTTDAVRRIYAGKEETLYYRVKLQVGTGEIYYSDPADILGNLDFRSFHIAREITRKEDLRHRRQRASVEGFILKAKRSGPPCPLCIDPNTGESTDSRCVRCFGTKFDGGYYAPMPAVYGDMATAGFDLKRDLQVEGMVMPNPVQVRFLAMPHITAYDVWVNRTADKRFFIHPVKIEAHVRGVPIVISAELRPIPFDDVIYTIPVQNA